MWSRNPQKWEATNPSKSTVWFRACVRTNRIPAGIWNTEDSHGQIPALAFR